MRKIILPLIICTLIDRLIKILCLSTLNVGDSIVVIKNFFAITLVTNTGAAFSILSSSTLFLIVLSIIVIGIIYFFFIKNQSLSNVMQVIYGILLGGIIGNLIDRVIYGYVIDYLNFNIFSYSFPVFNFADICIVISIFIIIISILKGDKNAVQSSKWWN